LDLDGLTQEYGLVFLSDLDWFFLDLDLVFLWIFGPGFSFGLWTGFSLDRWTRFFFGFLDLVFSFGRWIL
jgi:hypothetical protein